MSGMTLALMTIRFRTWRRAGTPVPTALRPKAFRTLNILEEHSRECLAIRVKRKLNSTGVIDDLTDLFILRGVPAHIRSDNGPEFIAKAVRDWIKAVRAKAVYIEPGPPWENGYCESFHERMRPSHPCKHALAGSGRIAQRRNLLFVARSANHLRKLEETLKHQATTQCIGLPPTSARSHHPDGPKADHALTFNMDLSDGADHDHCLALREQKGRLMTRSKFQNLCLIGRNLIAFLALLFISTATFAEDQTTFDIPENYYTLVVRAENMFARVYLNGAPIVNHARFALLNANPSIEEMMRHGTNTLVVDYEPFNADAQNYTPHEGVQIELILRHETQSRETSMIDLFHGRYLSETQRLEASRTVLLTGAPIVQQSATITVLPSLTVTPIDMNYPVGAPSDEFARRLTFEVEINDPSALTPPFEGAPVLSDTPEMRDKLYDAYARFYTAHANNDRALYGAQMSEVINRFAYVRGYKGREEKALDATLSGPPLSGGKGEELRPLPSRSAFQTAHLSFGSEGRMVRASDHPIMYVSTETGKKIAGVGVFFCMGTDGEMFVCYQPPS